MERFHSAKHGVINVIEQAAPHYSSFAPKILRDEAGTIVRILHEQSLGRPIKIMHAILDRWIDGTGEPVTWDTLVNCLRHAGANVVAHDVNESLI